MGGDQRANLGIGRDVGRGGVGDPGRARQDQGGDEVGPGDGKAQGHGGPHRDAADSHGFEAAGEGGEVIGEAGDGQVFGVTQRAGAVATAIQDGVGKAVAGGEHLGGLGGIATEAVLEQDHGAVARLGEGGQGAGIGGEEQGGVAVHQSRPRSRAATAGASSAVRPWVTRGPLKPAVFSRVRKWPKSITPLPAVAKLPSGARSLA